jgi:transcription termination factor Rho
MSGEQLERSILERKERTELHAIAEAMSLKPATRSKKADLIDQILRATGIGADAGSAASKNGHATSIDDAPVAVPKPRRTRRTTGAAAETTADTNGKAATATLAETTSVSESAVQMELTETKRSTATADGAQTDEPTTAAAPEGPKTSAEDGTPASSDRAAGGDHSDNGGQPGSGGEGFGEWTATAASETTQRSRPQRQGGGGQQGGGQQGGGQQQGGSGQGGGQQGGSQMQVDAGNRRTRRRRGRDRERGPGGEQRAQGQGQELQGGQEAPWQGELVPVKGLLDLRDEGYGFLRTSGYLPSPRDVYVSVSQARRFALRRGDAIEGACRPASPTEKYPALIRIDTICGMAPDEARQRPKFEDLTPLFPDSHLRLELPGDPANVTARIVDLISPIGKGQRGMMVSPPKAGKTTVMKQIAHSIEENNPDVHLMVLLVDERPEEATDWRRSVKGEVIASTFDRPAEEHVIVAELSIERAKRLVELGRDVVIILDGITRLARAYNLGQPASGRIMSGGVDSGALYPPKKFFGAARNIEEGGSLTILATALVETGSRMDEVIFEEFKGTGNMELRLDRKLSERRLYPAIDVNASSTRHEELLFDRSQLQQVWKLRRVLNAIGQEGNSAAGLELLMDKIRSTRSNDEFLAEIAKAPGATA